MADKPWLVLENKFDCPPEYVAAWLTDFRPDDGRWFGRDGKVEVKKEGNRVLLEGPHPMGWSKGVVTIESPTRWNARTEMYKSKGGALSMVGTVVETVRADGSGTIHRAELGMEKLAFPYNLMSPFMKPMVRRDLTAGFAKMREEMSAAHKAGKPPTG